MDKILKVCDLHEGDVPAELSVRVVGLGPDRTLDLCAEHREAFGRLPTAGADAAPPAPVALRPSPKGSSSRRPAKPRKAIGKAIGSDAAATGKRPGSRRALQQERALIRKWARQQGREIGDKGRMPAGLVEEYLRTQGQATG